MAVVMNHTAVDVVSRPFGAQIDGLGQLHIGIVLSLQHKVRHAECRPNGRVILVVLSGFLKRFQRHERVFFMDTDLTFLAPDGSRLRFAFEHLLYIFQRGVIVLHHRACVCAQ